MTKRFQKRARPAERTSLAVGALTTVIAYLLNIDDPEVLAALPVLIGLVASVVSWYVDRGAEDA